MIDLKNRLSLMMIMMALIINTAFPNDANALIWNQPPDIFAEDNENLAIDLAVTPQGNAFSAYSNIDGLFVSRFSNALQAYEPRVLIATGEIFNISVATDASQTALLIWQEEASNQVLTSYFNGTTWITPLPNPLDQLTDINTFPEVAMDGHGNGVAIWTREGVVPNDVVSSFFDGATQTWGPILTLNPPGTGGFSPEIDYSEDGTAVAVWRDNLNNLVASNFNGISWSPLPTTISVSLLSDSYQVRIDASGNALAIWSDPAGNIFSSYFNGFVWGPPQPVSLVPSAGFASLAMAPTGTAIVVWTDVATGTGFFSEFIGGVWTLPIPYALNVDDFNFAAAVDSFGNALIVWYDDVVNQSFSLYKPFGGLFAPLDLVTSLSDYFPEIAGLADNGRGFVDGSITQDEGQGAFGAYTLLPGQIAARGSFCNNRFATQTDRVNIIEWLPIDDTAVVAYYIYRNGVLIAVVPPTGPFIFFDHNRCRNDTDYYVISPVSATGIIGPGTVIVIRR